MRRSKASLLLLALLSLSALAQATQSAPRRAALAEVAEAQPGVAEAEQAALAVLEAGDKGGKPKRKPKPKKEKRPEPLPEEVLRGEAAEAAMEEEIAEFEEEGGLALSIVIWLFALAAPCGVLLYLRFKTNLLGAAPPEASALMATLAGALGFAGAGGGTAPGGAGSAGAALSAAAAAGRKADGAAQTAAPAPAAQSKGAILRQLEEENVRLRASMSAAAGPVPPSPKAGGASV